MKHFLFATMYCWCLVIMMPFTASAEKIPPFLQNSTEWAMQTLGNLSLEQKIGQLFMISVIADQEANQALVAQKSKRYHTDLTHARKLIQHYQVGGIIYLGKCDPYNQYHLSHEFQSLSTIPLLIGQDCEGTSIHLDKSLTFPAAMTLGAVTDNNLIYKLAQEIALQYQQTGVNILFAPVVDVNNNPNNPIINERSFGSFQENVAHKGIAYARALHDCGVLSCAKHFPGHGDTTVDSHHDLPLLGHTRARLEEIELMPFKELINSGVSCVMLAHLSIPSIEPNAKIPASLSPLVTTKLLQQNLNFKGLCITDALDMEGVFQYTEPGFVELQALRAGNDILLCPTDVPKAVTLIKKAIAEKTLSMQELDAHVFKILQAKEWVLKQQKNNHKELQLFSQSAQNIKREIYQNAVTIGHNNNASIPIITTNSSEIALVKIDNRTEKSAFEKKLNMPWQRYCITNNTSEDQITSLYENIRNYNSIVVAIYGMQRSPRTNFGITKSTITIVQKLKEAGKKIILLLFGNPYSMRFFKEYSDAILVCYDEEIDAQHAAADILLGKINARGVLPIIV